MKAFILPVFLLFLAATSIFYGVNELTVFQWDECRNGVSAMEMIESGNYLIPTFRGEPDHWSTKPPLFIAATAMSFKIFGFNNLGLRFPALFAGLLSVLLCGYITFSITKSKWAGLISGVVLLSTFGFNSIHVVRTADYDAFLVLFILLYAFCFYQFLRYKDDKWLSAFFLFLILGVLSKGIAAMIPLPALLIFALVKNEFFSFFKNRTFYFGLVAFLLIIVGYYLYRNTVQPGFLESMLRSEIVGRYSEDLGAGHIQHKWFYFHNLINDVGVYRARFLPWLYLLPLTILSIFTLSNKATRTFCTFALILSIQYFLVIHFAMNKLHWYDAPVYPFLTIVIGSGFVLTLKWMKKYGMFAFLGSCAILTSLISFTYLNTFIINNTMYDGQVKNAEYYINYVNEGLVDKNGITMVPFKKDQLLYYHLKVNGKNNGNNWLYKDWMEDFNSGERIVSCDKRAVQKLNERFEMDTLNSSEPCYEMVVKQKRLPK